MIGFTKNDKVASDCQNVRKNKFAEMSEEKKIQTSGISDDYSYKMLKCWSFHKQSTPPQPFGVALFGNLYNTQFNISLMERKCKLKMKNVG